MTRVTLWKSRVRESCTPGSVRAKAEWLTYATVTAPPGKTIIMRMVERGGRMAAQVIPNVRKDTLRDVVLENVEPGSAF